MLACFFRTSRQGNRPRARAERDGTSQDGFTLVEILVVLAIIGMVMSLVGPRVLGYLTDSKLKTARIQVDSLSSSAELFFMDNGRYPLETEGLQALVQAPAGLKGWNGPYIKGAAVPLDPWGKPYVYVSKDRGRTFMISFKSPDGRNANEVQPRQLSER